jgi:dipeptidyl aminopeptidase/acylaminoacyl peptidase
MRQMYEADAAACATDAAKPALILQGDLDYLVGSDNAELLGDALSAAGVADVTVTHYPRMGHSLEPVPEGIALYGEEIHRPYPWAVVGDIIAWLDER